MSEGRGTLLGVVGLIGVAVGIVALVIALDAQSSNKSDAQLSQSIRAELKKDVPAVKGALAVQSAAAHKAGLEAKKAQAGNQANRKAGAAAIAANKADLATDVNKLQKQISGMQKSITQLLTSERNQQAQINKQANQIQQLKITKKNRP